MTNMIPPRPMPPPRPAAGVQQLIQAAPYNAVERLEQLKEHQTSFWDEVVNNWQGWAGSFVLHVALLLLLGALIHGAGERRKEFWIQTALMDTTKEQTKESADDLFEDSLVDSDINEAPSVDADVMRPDPGYNELTPGAPDWITSGGHLSGMGEGGGGGDHLAGRSFKGYVRGLQKTGLEVMFVFDSTGSMAGPILEVKTRIRQLMQVVTYLVPNARIGVVTYRDKKKYDLDDYEYTVKYIPLQKGTKEGIEKLQGFLRGIEASGGGDIPEAVLDGVQTAVEKANWTPNTKKIIIVFGDAPPRSEDNGLSKMFELCSKWKDAGGIISCIDTTGGSKLMEEFRTMAADGGGEATFLNDERAIVKQLVVFIFGTKWEKEIDNVYNTVLKGPEDKVIGE